LVLAVDPSSGGEPQTSRLSQGRAGQHALVEVERCGGLVPPVRAFDRSAVTEPR
jgi:hypothetical protein